MGNSGLAYLSGDTLVVLPALMALYDSRLLSKYIYLFFPFQYPDFVQITLGSSIFQIGLLRYYLSMDKFSVQRVKRRYYAFLQFLCSVHKFCVSKSGSRQLKTLSFSAHPTTSITPEIIFQMPTLRDSVVHHTEAE